MSKYQYPKLGETWRERAHILDKEVNPILYVVKVDRVRREVHFASKMGESPHVYCHVKDLEDFFEMVYP
jgi:hypothetical protein